jgi:NTE family protein
MADVILSSGYLGFARHIGFLKALKDHGVAIDGICGTSSGAVIGAFYSAGYSLEQIENLFVNAKPIQYLRLNIYLWRGLFSLKPFILFLKHYLPSQIESLNRPFAVGVVDKKRHQHRLIHQGDLAYSVAASGAVPRLFSPVPIDGVFYQDGACGDRLGLDAWKKDFMQKGQKLVIHNIQSIHDKSYDKSSLNQANAYANDKHLMVHTPKAIASIWRLPDFRAQVGYAYDLTKQYQPRFPDG